MQPQNKNQKTDNAPTHKGTLQAHKDKNTCNWKGKKNYSPVVEA